MSFFSKNIGLEHKRYRQIENALFAFIGIGIDNIMPVLISKLNRIGDKTMAEAYLNCGHDKLIKAANEWAEKHGYIIKAGAGIHPVSWGKW